LNFTVAFQNIVPISLYISIEFVRLAQAAFIYADPDICYKVGDTKRRTVARSWNLSDDLGQIEYIFSDKTGTLTQNAMVFQQCSVGGKVYTGDGSVPENTVVDDKLGSSASSDDATPAPSGHNTDYEKAFGSQNGDDKQKKTKLADQVLAPFHDSEIDRDLAKRDSSEASNLYGFFCNLALCHTVLAQDEDGLIAYKAQSPDEAALVQAAADVGFVFLGRDKNILRIQTPHDPDVVEYELLNVLEFSSARKRMSVVVRRLSPGQGHGKLSLLSKGADNIIFERLGPGNEQLKKTTDSHLEEFANEGQCERLATRLQSLLT
jgi:phospholipid-translocating ATPase